MCRPQDSDLLMRVCRPRLGNVGVMRKVFRRDVAAELAWDNPRVMHEE